MVYNFNLGIGWASSGVEYAQMYRANMLRRQNIPAKYVFMDWFPSDNIERMTANLGYSDDEIIWLYTFFTDVKIAPNSYTLEMLEKTLPDSELRKERNGRICRYYMDDHNYYTVFLINDESDYIHAVEIVSRDCLIRKDYYTYCKYCSEVYAPYAGRAHLYARRFYNENGSCAYEECIDGDSIFYRFPHKILYNKQELVGYMVERMNLTSNDVAIIDRSTGIAQAIMTNCNDARVYIIIHADHFSESSTTDEHILWNNYYEYPFAMHKHVDAYITATDAQNKLMREQFLKYYNCEPNVVTIPVGSLDHLRKDDTKRIKHSLITASRLASEKHCDWIAEAVIAARKVVPDISLDIYGKGGDESVLRDLISKNHCGDYIRLMGQHKLDELYLQYDAYISASQSEGFGLTLMEAIGSGLPIIGFDVRYGNQTFIENGQNGYSIPIDDHMDKKEKVRLLTERLIRLFTEDDMNVCRAKSYEIAHNYLTEEVEKRWANLLKAE